jgi:signal transduction histidine kinase
LAATLFIPTLLLLLLLGVAYAGSVARETQQQVFLDRLRDVSYLSELALQSLATEDPDVVAVDLQRYRDVYGIGAAVLDQSGATWASNGLDVQSVPERHVALSGRRSEPTGSLLPWEVDQIVVAEPLFERGDLVGVVVTESDASYLSRGIWLNWGILALTGVLLSVIALVIADRTAVWVLRPVRAVEKAMAAMGRGQLAARIPESAGPPELGAIISRFNDMAEQVERLMRRQQEFVSNASHELRNPLNALMLRVEDLGLSVPDERSSEVASVRGEATRMAHILDALLLLAEDTSPEVEDAPVDVEAVLAERVESWRLLASERRIVLDASGAEELWAAVNRTVLESAFDAVMDNAVKFTPVDTPIEVTGRPEGDMVHVRVRDHGAGVPPEELDRMTERFWRSTAHHMVRGSGLGLAICSELLALGGGDLKLSLPAAGGLQVTIGVPRWQESR